MAALTATSEPTGELEKVAGTIAVSYRLVPLDAERFVLGVAGLESAAGIATFMEPDGDGRPQYLHASGRVARRPPARRPAPPRSLPPAFLNRLPSFTIGLPLIRRGSAYRIRYPNPAETPAASAFTRTQIWCSRTVVIVSAMSDSNDHNAA